MSARTTQRLTVAQVSELLQEDEARDLHFSTTSQALDSLYAVARRQLDADALQRLVIQRGRAVDSVRRVAELATRLGCLVEDDAGGLYRDEEALAELLRGIGDMASAAHGMLMVCEHAEIDLQALRAAQGGGK